MKSIPVVSHEQLPSARTGWGMLVDQEAQADRLRRVAKDRGYVKASDLAKAMGWNEATVRSAMNGTRPLTADSAEGFGRFLNVAPGLLLYGTEHTRADTVDSPTKETGSIHSTQIPPESSNAAVPLLASQAQGISIQPSEKLSLPIMGSAGGMAQGEVIFMNEGVQGYTTRPGIIEGVKDAYAIYVHGSSMEPALEQGWLAWVDPTRPTRPGDDVVIQLKNGQAYVKRLRRRTSKAVICSQFSPAKEVEYPADDVKSIHLIVGSTRVRG